MVATGSLTTAERAAKSAGISNTAIYAMVARALERRDIRGAKVIDVGCGCGQLYSSIGHRFEDYVGVDIVQYDGLDSRVRFVAADLDAEQARLPERDADAVIAVETIEHLENPRAFMRNLVEAVKPGKWVIVTTPNQMSLLSLLTLTLKGRFSAFQDVHYPAHLTALLEVDLLRIAGECGLSDAAIEYSRSGRIVFTARHYPRVANSWFPRLTSDNLLLIARKSSSTVSESC